MRIQKFFLGLLCTLSVFSFLCPQAASSEVLSGLSFSRYVTEFNSTDEELYANISNNKALTFLRENIPLFECPDKDFERTWYFRWWTYRKHIKKTEDGYVITEFLPQVPWAGKHNTISCAAGHHFYEGRWLHDSRYLDDYTNFWFRKGGEPRKYSTWLADAMYAQYLVNGERSLLIGLRNTLIENYQRWENDRLDDDGLFWQYDGHDGMEHSIGGHGKRPTINSYMYGDAVAISRIAKITGHEVYQREYEAKAEKLKTLVQRTLWDAEAKFFKTRPSRKGTNLEPKSSSDASIPRHTWWGSGRNEKEEWIEYQFAEAVDLEATEVYWFDNGGACLLPKSWHLSYWDGKEWFRVKNRDAYGVRKDLYNRVNFYPIRTDKLRLTVELQPERSSGVLEWRVYSDRTNIALEATPSSSHIDARGGAVLSALNDGDYTHFVSVRELHGFTPWYFNLPDPGYEAAWKQLMDPEGFYAYFGPTTAERRHPVFQLAYDGHECQWNGPSWPYATSVTLTAMANLLCNYEQDIVTREDYFDVLTCYTRSHLRRKDDGTIVPWIDENLNPYTGDWIARTRLSTWEDGRWSKGKGGKERGKDYNHSTYNDLIITGLVGLRPRADDIVEVHPLLPDNKWDYFCLDNILYHRHIITIIWDRDGEKYNKGAGLTVLCDGQKIASAKSLERVTGELTKEDFTQSREVEKQRRREN